MGVPSKIESLPPDLRLELNRQIKRRNFARIDEVHAWLSDQIDARGLEPVARTQVGTWSQKLKAGAKELADLAEASAYIVEAMGDRQATVAQAAISMLQNEALKVLIQARESGELGPKEIQQLADGLAKVGKTEVAVRKYAEEAAAKLEAAKQAAAGEVRGLALQNGLSDELADQFAAKLLGMKVPGINA